MIPGIKDFKVNAILDTGAPKCCIDIKVVQKEALEESKWSMTV